MGHGMHLEKIAKYHSENTFLKSYQQEAMRSSGNPRALAYMNVYMYACACMCNICTCMHVYIHVCSTCVFLLQFRSACMNPTWGRTLMTRCTHDRSNLNFPRARAPGSMIVPIAPSKCPLRLPARLMRIKLAGCLVIQGSWKQVNEVWKANIIDMALPQNGVPPS